MKLKMFVPSMMLIVFSFSAFVLADVAIRPVADQIVAAATINNGDFVTDVISIIQGVKGSVPVGLKVAGIVLLLLALVKVSFLQTFWAKLGKFQAFAAPILGLAVGLLIFGFGGGSLSFAAVLAYMTSGAGAIALHEIFKTVKSIPGIGPVWLSIIGVIESALGGGSSS